MVFVLVMKEMHQNKRAKILFFHGHMVAVIVLLTGIWFCRKIKSLVYVYVYNTSALLQRSNSC